LKWVTPIDGSFTPGKEPVQFVMKNPDARFSPLICFEDAFAEEAREHATPDTDFLVNLTNDGWFGERGGRLATGRRRGFSRGGKRPSAGALHQQRPDLLD
jgi:predicted amidohydrolase